MTRHLWYDACGVGGENKSIKSMDFHDDAFRISWSVRLPFFTIGILDRLWRGEDGCIGTKR